MLDLAGSLPCGLLSLMQFISHDAHIPSPPLNNLVESLALAGGFLLLLNAAIIQTRAVRMSTDGRFGSAWAIRFGCSMLAAVYAAMKPCCVCFFFYLVSVGKVELMECQE